jgi:OOP family OmpA-OmpF porin
MPGPRTPRRSPLFLATALLAAALAAQPLLAAQGDLPVGAVPPLPAQKSPPAAAGAKATPAAKPGAAAKANQPTIRRKSIPAKGLFVGDKLSESTKAQLTELMLDAIGSRIELALLVPTGPWKIDGAGKADEDLNTARLQALRRFLTDRGVDPSKVVVESRIDKKIKTPRLDVELVTTPAAE